MTRPFRSKATVFSNPIKITAKQLSHIKAQALTIKSYWNTKIAPDSTIIKNFKSEIKDHYYYEQQRLCCYCSMELAKSKDSHDAEHIIDKGKNPSFMFEYENLALACKPCNRSKGTKRVLSSPNKPSTVPTNSIDYLIVHPHLDEWNDHLDYDEFDRIIPKNDSPKGIHTLNVCGIHSLNLARLADKFTKGNREAENFLVEFYEESSIEKKRLKLELLRNLASRYNLPEALAVVTAVEGEFERLVTESLS